MMVFAKIVFASDKLAGTNKTNRAISLDDAESCRVDAKFEKFLFFHQKSTSRECCESVRFGAVSKQLHLVFTDAQSIDGAEFPENEDFILPAEKCVDDGFSNRKEVIFLVFICNNIACVLFGLLLI